MPATFPPLVYAKDRCLGSCQADIDQAATIAERDRAFDIVDVLVGGQYGLNQDIDTPLDSIGQLSIDFDGGPEVGVRRVGIGGEDLGRALVRVQIDQFGSGDLPHHSGSDHGGLPRAIGAGDDPKGRHSLSAPTPIRGRPGSDVVNPSDGPVGQVFHRHAVLEPGDRVTTFMSQPDGGLDGLREAGG